MYSESPELLQALADRLGVSQATRDLLEKYLARPSL
jgi:hypothetical protein